jgi:hypothetical protein
VLAGANHVQEEVAPVVLDAAPEHLLLGRERARTLDRAERVDRRADAQVADALRSRRRAVLADVRAVLHGHLREPDPDRADVAAEDVAPVERLARADRVVEPLEVDCGKASAPP